MLYDNVVLEIYNVYFAEKITCSQFQNVYLPSCYKNSKLAPKKLQSVSRI